MDFEKLEPYQGGLAELGVPTLLLWGDEDQFAPVAAARRFEREIPGARLVVDRGRRPLRLRRAAERCADEVVALPGYELVEVEPDAHDAAAGAGADLDQVAELVDDPEPAPGELSRLRPGAPGERIRDAPARR